MKYDLHFSMAALLVYAVVYFFLLANYNTKSNNVRWLKRLLECLFLTDFMDIVTAITISYPQHIPVWLHYVLNVVFFEMEMICISLLPIYIRYVLDPENGKSNLFDRINGFVLIATCLIFGTTPWTHLGIYFDENRNYCKGPCYAIVLVLPAYFLIYSFIRLLSDRKRFTKKQFNSIIGFIAVSVTGSLLQSFVTGSVLFAFFSYSIGVFIITFGLETPDYIKLKEAMVILEENKLELEKAKRNAEEQNKAIRSMTKSATWSIRMDKDHNIQELYWSDEFFWMLGYEREELIGQEGYIWGDSLHPDEKDRVVAAFGRGFRGEGEYDEIYRLRSKNGEYRWYRGTGKFKQMDNGESCVFQGIIQDVHNEKLNEDLTKEKTAALEELEKSQESLKEALEKAEAADRAKSDFLANMSHEIRTPINAVLGMNELISRESSEVSIQNYSSNVADAGQALLSLINDILDFSKIEAGRMELAPTEYELSSLLREVYNMIQIRCFDKGLKFEIINSDKIPNQLYGDEVRIRQILINILNNALKYTDEGSVTLKVDFEQIDEQNIELILTATDTGIGIKEENIPLLFTSFKRIDLVHNRKREGTGLGLSITKSFVEMMGGRIEVKSVYGQGSTFIVRIPQGLRGDALMGVFEGGKHKEQKNKYEVPFTAPNARILVVDDVAMNLKVIKGLLRQTQIQMDMVSSGAECLEKIAETVYDVIFLDHMMPEMDGIETMERMRQDTTHPNQTTPVIMLTANAILGAKEEYLEQGFEDYLSKPVRSEELENMLRKYIASEKINLM